MRKRSEKIFDKVIPSASSKCGLLVGAACLILWPLTGCRQSTVPVSDADQAEALITETFNQWKAGATIADQRAKSPPIFVSEELWENGGKLTDYELTAPGELFGTNVRFHVKLKVTDTAGSSQDRNVKYLVTTTPARTIAREDR